jgi:hypothetical protein
MKHLKSFKTLCTGRKAESQSSQVQGKFLTGPKGSFTLAKFVGENVSNIALRLQDPFLPRVAQHK